MKRSPEQAGTKAPLVNEGWTGPGRRDATITPLGPEEDGLHTDVGKKGMYEWWYFDAHIDIGHTIVVFFYAANPNPGKGGKPGIEIVLIRPDGTKTQKFVPYERSAFTASRTAANVKIGDNYLSADQSPQGLPTYQIHVKDQDLSCDLRFKAQVKGWKPGTGLSQFGNLGYFAWVVPFARASVDGTITDGDQILNVTGVGYHDHNWLDFQFPSIIDYWMWGRIYSQHYTVSYAFIQCNDKVDNHQVKVLMLADGKEVVLSSGEFDFVKEDFLFDQRAKHSYPRRIVITAPDELKVDLRVKKVLESQDMLDNFSAPIRFIAKYIMRMKPGYFRLASDFEISVTRAGVTCIENGIALHEIVAFRNVAGGSSPSASEDGT
jgi:predicted secreted hydrolase